MYRMDDNDAISSQAYNICQLFSRHDIGASSAKCLLLWHHIRSKIVIILLFILFYLKLSERVCKKTSTIMEYGRFLKPTDLISPE